MSKKSTEPVEATASDIAAFKRILEMFGNKVFPPHETTVHAKCYGRTHDDHGGNYTGTLSAKYDKITRSVIISITSRDTTSEFLRYRVNPGKKGLRTRNAILLLIACMHMDRLND